jgi:hypothetical protein
MAFCQLNIKYHFVLKMTSWDNTRQFSEPGVVGSNPSSRAGSNPKSGLSTNSPVAGALSVSIHEGLTIIPAPQDVSSVRGHCATRKGLIAYYRVKRQGSWACAHGRHSGPIATRSQSRSSNSLSRLTDPSSPVADLLRLRGLCRDHRVMFLQHKNITQNP